MSRKKVEQLPLEVNRVEQGKLPNSAKVVGAVGFGAVTGATVANQFFPSTIEYAPGFEAEVKLVAEQGAHIKVLDSTISLPNAIPETPIPFFDGIEAELVGLNPSNNQEAISAYAALFTDLKDSVALPTAEIIAERIATGASIGAVTAGALSIYILDRIKRGKKSTKKTEAQIKALQSGGASSDKSKNLVAGELRHSLDVKQKKQKIITGLAIVAAACALGGGAKTLAGGASSDKSKMKPFGSQITKSVPEFEGATASGFIADGANLASFGLFEYINDVDQFWKNGYSAVSEALDEFENQGGFKYLNDPNLTPILHVSDIHCNGASVPHYLGPLMKRLNVPTIVNTGDTFTNSKTLFFEQTCSDDFINIVRDSALANKKKTTLVSVAGNHDPKEPINIENENIEVITLTNDKPTAVTDNGINFTGNQDPTITALPPTLPEDPEELKQVVAKQGAELANAACEVMDQTDKVNIGIAHRIQATYKVSHDGCARLTLSGHGHEETTTSEISENGKRIYKHEGGSATGAHKEVTRYAKPGKDAVVSILLLDNGGNLIQVLSPTLHPDGTAEIKTQEISDDNDLPDKSVIRDDFLKQYSDSYWYKFPIIK